MAIYHSTTNATSAEDYLKTVYQDKSEVSDAEGYTFVNDNQTTIGKNHEAWQIENTREVNASPGSESILRELTIYAINEGRVYRFEYTAEKGKFSEYLPAVRYSPGFDRIHSHTIATAGKNTIIHAMSKAEKLNFNTCLR